MTKIRSFCRWSISMPTQNTKLIYFQAKYRTLHKSMRSHNQRNGHQKHWKPLNWRRLDSVFSSQNIFASKWWRKTIKWAPNVTTVENLCWVICSPSGIFHVIYRLVAVKENKCIIFWKGRSSNICVHCLTSVFHYKLSFKCTVRILNKITFSFFHLSAHSFTTVHRISERSSTKSPSRQILGIFKWSFWPNSSERQL